MTRKLVLTALLGFVPLAASAGTDTANMSVSASVTDNCTISAGALSFGAYDVLGGADLDGSATLTVACTSGTSSTVTLGQGANADTGSTDAAPLRRMSGGSDHLSYDLYQDSGRTTVFGNTSGTGVAYNASSSSPASVTVYGRVPGGQSVAAGSFSDTVVATITF